MSVRQSYLSAVHAFAGLVDRMPEGVWDHPGLGEWSLRTLVGHTCGAGIRAVLETVGKPAGFETVLSAEDYFTARRPLPPETHTGSGTVAARAEGRALGTDPAATIRGLVDEVTVALTQVLDDELVHSSMGGIRLFAWLPTRTFEVVVHSLDLAQAADLPVDIPAPTLTEAAVLAARITTASGDGVTLLRALTGRGELPPGYSVC